LAEESKCFSDEIFRVLAVGVLKSSSKRLI